MLPSFDPTQVDALLRESWGPGVVDPSPSSITLPSMQTAGFSSTRQYQDAFSTECDPFRNAPSTPPPFSFSSLFGLLGHAIDNTQKIKAFTQKLKEEYQQDRKQAAVDCLFSIPPGGGKFLKEIVDLTLFPSPLSRFTDISQRVDHLADSLNDSYMLFIENTGFSINEDSTSSHLGKETGYWIFPLKGDKPFKIAGEALLPRLSLTLEKLGIKVSEDVLTKALRTHSTKELQLAEAMSGKAVSNDIPFVPINRI